MGRLYPIFLCFKTTVKKFSVGNFSTDYSFDIFETEGGLNEYLYASRGNLFVYDHNRNVLFSGAIASSGILEPVSFSFLPAGKDIGFLEPGKKD
jgi:hypothetical protein